MSNSNYIDPAEPMYDVRMPMLKPRMWNPSDVYQQYALHLLASDPQCWGKYNVKAIQQARLNFWIYKTVMVKGKPTVIEVINYKRWKRIMFAYFAAARIRIIFFGEGLSLGRLGLIKARRVERNFSNRMINWAATAKVEKVEKDGKLVPKHYVYYDDPDYIMLGWRKYMSYTNEAMYEFEASPRNRIGNSFKNQFIDANRANPVLKFLYEYIPMKLNKLSGNGDLSVL